MRTLLRSLTLIVLSATPALAQAEEKSILDPTYGTMAWTLIIFVALAIVLSKFAFKPILASVESREKALEDAITQAKEDREAAAKLLAEYRANLDASREEGQKLITDARVAAERVRADLVSQAKTEQNAMLARARQEIETEKTNAIAQLRREAVELAIAGAGKVIEKNLDQAGNRQLVESFLSSLNPASVSASR